MQELNETRRALRTSLAQAAATAAEFAATREVVAAQGRALADLGELVRVRALRVCGCVWGGHARLPWPQVRLKDQIVGMVASVETVGGRACDCPRRDG